MFGFHIAYIGILKYCIVQIAISHGAIAVVIYGLQYSPENIAIVLYGLQCSL